MRIAAALPPGVAALFFESAARRRATEARLTACLENRGYREAILPVLDYAAPYEPLLDERGRSETYRFVGRDGQLLALRSDFTPMLARLLAPRAVSLPEPLRLYYRGDVVRYDATPRGQTREFYQLGAELVGAGGETAEAELVETFCEALSAAGPENVRVVLGAAGALAELFAGRAERAELAAAVVRRDRAVARRAGPALLEIVEAGVPRCASALGPHAATLERLTQLADELSGRYPSLRVTVDLAEFADLAAEPSAGGRAGSRGYYDGIVFSAFTPRSAAPVGGGGRYDGLFAALGANLPAVGFSLAVDRLAAEGGS